MTLPMLGATVRLHGADIRAQANAGDLLFWLGNPGGARHDAVHFLRAGELDGRVRVACQRGTHPTGSPCVRRVRAAAALLAAAPGHGRQGRVHAGRVRARGRRVGNEAGAAAIAPTPGRGEPVPHATGTWLVAGQRCVQAPSHATEQPRNHAARRWPKRCGAFARMERRESGSCLVSRMGVAPQCSNCWPCPAPARMASWCGWVASSEAMLAPQSVFARYPHPTRPPQGDGIYLFRLTVDQRSVGDCVDSG